MKAALLVLTLAGALQDAPPAGAPAASVVTDGERLKKVQERRAALEQELTRMRGEEKSLLGEVERLELELSLRSEELTEIQITLRRTRAELDATVARVGQLEKSLAEARPALARHARALYKLGDMSYVRLLLSIDRPSDFFRGYRLVTTLARRDNARVSKFRSDLAAFTTEKAVLEERTRESLALRNKLATARRNLDAQRARKTELLTSLVERKELNAAYVDELAQAETRLQALLSGLGEGAVEVPLGAFRGGLPWPAISAAASTRASTPTRSTTASRSRRRPTPRCAPCTGAGWSSPSASAATGSWWSWTTAASTTRSTRSWPTSRSHRASRLRPGQCSGAPIRRGPTGRGCTSRCATRGDPKTPRAGWPNPDILIP